MTLSHGGSNKLQTYNLFAFKTLSFVIHPSFLQAMAKEGGF